MSKLFIPEGYKSPLDVYRTQKAISFIKRTFQDRLSEALNLKRVSAPLFVTEASGLNDNLNGTERAVSFDIPLGKLLAKTVGFFRGERYRSRIVERLAFLYYNKRFPGEGEYAWLSRDTEMVSDKAKDELSSFRFTVSAYFDLFRMLGECNGRKWFSLYPREMPTLIMSGENDPVGNYNKGNTKVYKELLIAGVKNVKMKTYPGARHELFNEINREEVYSDVAAWLSEICR